MNRHILSVFLAALILSFSACKKGATPAEEEITPTNKVAADGFAYEPTRSVTISVRLLSRTNEPIKGALVSFYDPAAVKKGREITKVLSDKNGYVNTKLNIPASMVNLVIDPSYIGLASNVTAYISNNNLTAIIGGETGFAGNIVIPKTSSVAYNNRLSSIGGYRNNAIASLNTAASFPTYNAADYDALGRPKAPKLLAPDAISFSDLMAKVQVALPNGTPINPTYTATSVPTDLKIERLADVWITFVHEGADNRNTLGFYTYPTGNPPTNEDQITNAQIIFPNCSIVGGNGAGNMLSGDKVHIGRFPAGTSVGFLMIGNGYNFGFVDFTSPKFFTTEALNPEADLSKRRHNVVLHNVVQRTFLIGFEDTNRMPGNGSDNDYNDLVFYAQSNPVDAISPVNIPTLEEQYDHDQDLDGIPDFIDEYPSDPARAYNRYYPSETVWGTTAFEDNWPFAGDYDLNDVVVSYRYRMAMSATNQLVDIRGEYKALAAGAEYQNGFGVQLPFVPSQIQSVTGVSSSGQIQLDGKGLEKNQSKAVIFPFDNYRNLFGPGSSVVNTKIGVAKIESPVVTVNIQLTSPLSDDYTAFVPFNPFITSNLDRSREVHLVNHAPTDLASATLFNTGADNSNALTGRYYITSQNRPFALDFYGPFEYPIEKRPIYDVYTSFANWALTNGVQDIDWHYNPAKKVESLIYR
ncbi:MAG: LruC domain-containing protein [Bacteroidota bacterium]